MTLKITEEMIPAVRECLNQLVSEYVREDVTFPEIKKGRDGVFTAMTRRMSRNMGIFGVTMRHYHVLASLHPLTEQIEEWHLYHTAYAIGIDLTWRHKSGGCNGQDVYRARQGDVMAILLRKESPTKVKVWGRYGYESTEEYIVELDGVTD